MFILPFQILVIKNHQNKPLKRHRILGGNIPGKLSGNIVGCSFMEGSRLAQDTVERWIDNSKFNLFQSWTVEL